MLIFVFFFSSRRRHTSCALVTGVQTCALPIWPAREAGPPASFRRHRHFDALRAADHAARRRPLHRAVAEGHDARLDRRDIAVGLLQKALAARGQVEGAPGLAELDRTLGHATGRARVGTSVSISRVAVAWTITQREEHLT